MKHKNTLLYTFYASPQHPGQFLTNARRLLTEKWQQSFSFLSLHKLALTIYVSRSRYFIFARIGCRFAHTLRRRIFFPREHSGVCIFGGGHINHRSVRDRKRSSENIMNLH
jgi:hypothetical protein